MTRTARAVLALLALSCLLSAAAVAAPRIHRTKLPPPLALPTALSVDETEWSVRPGKRLVAAGEVTLRVVNRGMDDHDLVVVDAAGTTHRVDLGPGAAGTIRAQLTPGVWKLYCSLFGGTPESHEALGMVAYIRAKRDPTRAVPTAR